MGTNSEARKRVEAGYVKCAECARLRVACEHCRVASVVRRSERRREVTRDALAAVYPHVSMVEADALLDQLDTLGARVVLEGEGLIGNG